jgi:peptidylprolyl isomerase
MRITRLVLGATAVAVLLAACGDSPAEESTASTSLSSAAVTTPPSAAPVATNTIPGAVGTSPETSTPASTGPQSTVPKPSVSLPATSPTSLVVTDRKVGTGPAAKVGDTVVVNYVGVVSATGKEFDNSYDKGQSFPVPLGAGKVIKGWDQGLVGVQAGGQRQLDIPASLAYGDNPPGGDIKAGDALSFVVDVIAVISTPPKSDAPSVTVAPSANTSAVAIKDLVLGTGAELQPTQSAATEIIAYRLDTGAQIYSSWDSGLIQTLDLKAGLPQGLLDGLKGMKVGGRRQITVPFAQGFGAAGNSNIGLPANTDMVLVVDLVGAY